MNKYFVLGMYYDLDLFAKGQVALLSIEDAIKMLWIRQEIVNSDIGNDDSLFEYKTRDDLNRTPIVSDGHENWGIFEVEAHDKDQALMKPLRTHGMEDIKTNQIYEIQNRTLRQDAD